MSNFTLVKEVVPVCHLMAGRLMLPIFKRAPAETIVISGYWCLDV